MPNRRFVCLTSALCSWVLAGCSGNPAPKQGEAGGALAVGGSSTGSSGSSGTGTAGSIATGGVAGIGGAPTGGTLATGGSTSTVAATGGALATGGSTSTVAATGGTAATAGSVATGGKAATGGNPGTGGVVATGGKGGGSPATGGANATGGKAATGGMSATGGKSTSVTLTTGGTSTTGGNRATGGALGTGGTKAAGGTSSTGGTTGTGGLPSGWLYTSGGKIYVSNGSGSGTQWMGRGVNFDDIYLCGYNYTLWMTSPEQTLLTMVSGLMSAWKPTFVRVSLAMDSNPTVSSWLSNPAQYKTPMTSVINSLGSHAGVYVLVTLRTDASMAGPDEATQMPTDSSNTPDANAFPTGTDATYQALVDSFASSNFVLFGISNEPGGNAFTNAKISAAMKHAVGVIRAEEDRLGVPHHIVSVQGNGWTSDISFYATTPLTNDNVVYEVHGYPPSTSSYTYANIPVILGEYGSLTSGTSAAFYADLEAKQIPNLAWDFDSFSNCAPDLLTVNQSASNLVPTAWGTIVQNYLLAHAP